MAKIKNSPPPTKTAGSCGHYIFIRRMDIYYAKEALWLGSCAYLTRKCNRRNHAQFLPKEEVHFSMCG
jgi:hypothetical protein